MPSAPPPSELTPEGRRLLDRRRFLSTSARGIQGVALAYLLAREGLLGGDPAAPGKGVAEGGGDDRSPIRPVIRPEAPLAARPPHFPGKARRAVVIFCSGAISHVDTFDHKPELERLDGKPMPGAEKLITFQGEQGSLVRGQWPFRPRGECGKQISDLLPHLAELADEMCFIHSMTSATNTHGPGENFMSTGFTLEGFPSAGAWVSYALGTEAEDLPAFVAIPDPRGVPQTGPLNWASGFLPAVFQGTALESTRPPLNLFPPAGIDGAEDRAVRSFLRAMNERHLERHPGDTELAARIASYELAAKMQLSVPAVSDLSGESPETRKLYGVDDPDPLRAGFARNCLLARRLLERGVRFVEVFNGAYAMGEGVGNWDGHRTIKSQYEVHGPILDRPAAALLRDLKARGLLEDTVVLFTTEFGRMPTFQKGASGRDHNPHGFTVWLAGAGVKRATSFGATDEFGFKAREDVVTTHDLHATLLHLFGLDHKRLTFYHNGAERRLTDVHGEVIRGVLT